MSRAVSLAMAMVLASSAGCAPVYSPPPSPVLAFESGDQLVKDGRRTELAPAVCGNAEAEADARAHTSDRKTGRGLVISGGSAMIGSLPFVAGATRVHGAARVGLAGAAIGLLTAGFTLAVVGIDALRRSEAHRRNAVNRYNARPAICLDPGAGSRRGEASGR